MKNSMGYLMMLGTLLLPQLINAAEVDDIERFARAYIEAQKLAWEQGEFDALQALEDPDAVYQNIDGTVIRGWEEHKQSIMDTKRKFGGAEIKQEWRYMMGEGNMFVVSYVWTIGSSGRQLQIRGIAVGRLKDGKLVEEWGAGSMVSVPTTPTPVPPSPTPVPPTSTPVPPTPTPGTMEVVASQIEDLVGIWETNFQGKVAYMQFEADGTLKLALTLEGLENKPRLSGTFWFEGTVFHMEESYGRGTGKYEVRVQKEGDKAVHLSFTEINDPESMRARDFTQGMSRVEP